MDLCFFSTHTNLRHVHKMSAFGQYVFRVVNATRRMRQYCALFNAVLYELSRLVTSCTVVQAVVQATGQSNREGPFSTPTAP